MTLLPLRDTISLPCPWIWAVLWLLLPIEFSRSDAMRLYRLDHKGNTATAFLTRRLTSGIWSHQVQSPTTLRLLCCMTSGHIRRPHAGVRPQPQLSPTFESSQNLQKIPFLSCWLPSSCLDLLSRSLRHHGIESSHSHYALPKSLPAPQNAWVQ